MGKLVLDRLNVVLADDNEHMRRLVRVLLKSFGIIDVRDAADGAEALKLMREKTPDLLLTNWNMAPLDGLELVKFIRTSPDSPNIFLPIIMMTAHADRKRVFTARDAGVNEFLVKPLSAKALYSRIAATVEKPRQFVRTNVYFGPDRRRKKDGEYIGEDRRGRDGASRQLPPDTPMDQQEINELFNPS